MKLFIFALVVGTLLAASGCTQRRGNGFGIVPDAGADGRIGTGDDSGVTVDSGRPDTGVLGPDLGTVVDAGRDMGTVVVDAGRDMGTVVVDAGHDSGVACAPAIVDHVTGPYCSSETLSCVNACTTGTCFQACLDADTNPDCNACVNVNFASCVNAAGCQTSYNTYACCYDAHFCADTADPSACVDTYCSSEYSSWSSCASAVSSDTCNTSVASDCFSGAA